MFLFIFYYLSLVVNDGNFLKGSEVELNEKL